MRGQYRRDDTFAERWLWRMSGFVQLTRFANKRLLADVLWCVLGKTCFAMDFACGILCWDRRLAEVLLLILR